MTKQQAKPQEKPLRHPQHAQHAKHNDAVAEKQQRLARALRANLRKRKDKERMTRQSYLVKDV